MLCVCFICVNDRHIKTYTHAKQLNNRFSQLPTQLLDSEEELIEMIKMMDYDGDGAINYEEFLKIMKKANIL